MSLLRNVKKLNERKKLCEILLEMQLLDQGQLQYALDKSAKTKTLLGTLLVAEGIVNEENMAKALGNQFDLPCIDLQKEIPEPEAIRTLPESVIRQHNILPLAISGQTLKIGIADPVAIVGLNSVRELAGFHLQIVV